MKSYLVGFYTMRTNRSDSIVIDMPDDYDSSNDGIDMNNPFPKLREAVETKMEPSCIMGADACGYGKDRIRITAISLLGI